MIRCLDSLYLSTEVKVVGLVAEVGDGGVGGVVGAEDFDGFLDTVGLVYVLD